MRRGPVKEASRDLGVLRELASIAVNEPANRTGLVHLADCLKEGLGLEQACFVYADNMDWLTCGDSACGNDPGTGKHGLWIVQQQAQTLGVPVAFAIESRRVGDFAPASAAQDQSYVALRLPIREGVAEMVIVRRRQRERAGERCLRLLEAARPALVVFLERMLNGERAERKRQQATALVNGAEVLARTNDPLEVLTDIAAAMSSFSGFELVTIALWDEATQALGARTMGLSRWRDTALGNSWLNATDRRFDQMFIEAIKLREQMPSPDLQNDSRNSQEVLDFFKWIMVVSGTMVPVYFEDEPLAAISFASYRPHSFPPEEIEFLNGMAAELAVGLKAMRMYGALTASREQLEDYTQRLEANTRIEHRMARTDALTGIPNRRYVEEVIEAERARVVRYGGELSVGVMDVDRFKALNDEYGHEAGDEVLIQLARLARQSCRKGDVVGRYGGDEFLFVLPESGLDAAWEFADRFRRKVEQQPFRLPEGKFLSVNVSLGMAQIAREENLFQLVADADVALYEAKAAGGNRVCCEQAA